MQAVQTTFTIHDTPVDTSPFRLAIQDTSEAVTLGSQQVAQKIQGLTRTLRNRNEELGQARELIGRVHAVLAPAVPDNQVSPDDVLAQTVVQQRDEAIGQRDEALEREQALLQTLHDAIPDSGEEADPAALVGQLIQAKTDAEEATATATQAQQQAQQQAQRLNVEVERLRALVATLTQQVQQGTAGLLGIGADLQIDPVE